MKRGRLPLTTEIERTCPPRATPASCRLERIVAAMLKEALAFEAAKRTD
jgi:hypothetical protein